MDVRAAVESASLTFALHETREASLQTLSTASAKGLSMQDTQRTKHVARCGQTNAVVRTRSVPTGITLRHRRHRARPVGAYSMMYVLDLVLNPIVFTTHNAATAPRMLFTETLDMRNSQQSK